MPSTSYTALIFSSLLGITMFTFFGLLGNRPISAGHVSAAEGQ